MSSSARNTAFNVFLLAFVAAYGLLVVTGGVVATLIQVGFLAAVAVHLQTSGSTECRKPYLALLACLLLQLLLGALVDGDAIDRHLRR